MRYYTKIDISTANVYSSTSLVRTFVDDSQSNGSNNPSLDSVISQSGPSFTTLIGNIDLQLASFKDMSDAIHQQSVKLVRRLDNTKLSPSYKSKNEAIDLARQMTADYKRLKIIVDGLSKNHRSIVKAVADDFLGQIDFDKRVNLSMAQVKSCNKLIKHVFIFQDKGNVVLVHISSLSKYNIELCRLLAKFEEAAAADCIKYYLDMRKTTTDYKKVLSDIKSDIVSLSKVENRLHRLVS